MKDFSHLKSVIMAERGTPGGHDNMHGKDAKHRFKYNHIIYTFLLNIELRYIELYPRLSN